MTTATEEKTFAGLKVTGSIERSYRKSVTQISKEELEHLIVTALNAEDVEAVAWSQYTPYFNDGDTCEFGADMGYRGGVRLVGMKTADELEEAEEQDEDAAPGFITTSNPRFAGGQEKFYEGYDNTTREYKYRYGETFSKHPAHDAVVALEHAINSGAADHALLDAFGDHCTVRVSRAGIVVEWYEHE